MVSEDNTLLPKTYWQMSNDVFADLHLFAIEIGTFEQQLKLWGPYGDVESIFSVDEVTGQPTCLVLYMYDEAICFIDCGASETGATTLYLYPDGGMSMNIYDAAGSWSHFEPYGYYRWMLHDQMQNVYLNWNDFCDADWNAECTPCGSPAAICGLDSFAFNLVIGYVEWDGTLFFANVNLMAAASNQHKRLRTTTNNMGLEVFEEEGTAIYVEEGSGFYYFYAGYKIALDPPPQVQFKSFRTLARVH